MSIALERAVPRRVGTAAPRSDTGTIWVLTDSRYLGQRMPSALLDWLRVHGHAARLVVADDEDTLAQISPNDGPAWPELEAGDLVVIRSRHPFALTMLRAAESRRALSCESWAAIEAVRNKAECAI